MSKPTTNDRGEPDRIWLQVHGDCHEDEIDGARVDLTSEAVTWCCERVLDLDVEYVRADLVDDMQREAGVRVADLQAENAKLRELLNEYRELLKRARWLYEMANSFRCSSTQSTAIQYDVDEAIKAGKEYTTIPFNESTHYTDTDCCFARTGPNSHAVTNKGVDALKAIIKGGSKP